MKSLTQSLPMLCLVEFNCKELGKIYKIINLHKSYGNKKSFWEGLGEASSLKGENVIVGDLNLTLN
jgi:hypothetical protein